MPLAVNLRHLEEGPLHLHGELPASELELADLDEMVQPASQLRYDLELTRQGQGLLVQGRLEMLFECVCVRCFKSFEFRLELTGCSALLPWEGEDKVLVSNDSVDLTPHVREDIVLALPQHPLCGPECSGWSARPPAGGKSLCGASETPDASSAWAELNKLKF
jgi:uncharacterized metal-binding protein YceD (DUF177 family)